MDIWWPRRGVFPYSFAPAGHAPAAYPLRASKFGGRYYETFLDETANTRLGALPFTTAPWATELHLARTPLGSGETRIALRHSPTKASGTRVVYEQDGFAKAGVPDLAAYYQIGCRQTLSAYVAHCQALYELGKLSEASPGA